MGFFEIVGMMVVGYFGAGAALVLVWMLPLALMRGLRKNITAYNLAIAIVAWPLGIVEEYNAARGG